MVEILDVRIDRITVPHSHRKPREAKVASLAESLSAVGRLLQPIMLRGSVDQTEYPLVFGANRLAAAKLLGWETIPAVFTDMGDDQCELAEIDENIVRSNLSVIEEVAALAKRKQVYLRLHPETAHGGDRKSSRQNGDLKPSDDDMEPTAPEEVPSFVADTAAKTGRSKRTVQRDTATGERLSAQAANILRDTPIAESKTQVQALASLPKSEQVEVARAIKRGEAESVPEAVASLAAENDEPEPCGAILQAINTDKIKPTRDQYAALAAMDEADQEAILEAVVAERQSLRAAITEGPAEAGPEEIGRNIASDIDRLCRAVHKLVTDYLESADDPWITEKKALIEGDLRALKNTFYSCKAVHLCPKCQGAGCTTCKQTGRVTKYVLDQAG